MKAVTRVTLGPVWPNPQSGPGRWDTGSAQLDPVSQTPHFSYEEDETVRTVWYQGARGTEAHLPVLRRYGVRNTVLWALDFEDPGLWGVLARGT
ncbi:hypothetical protein [Streptomyces sp. NPDC048527]|uniref:hypothetical protein n=1 Tax=Streptomyces sp. NPDC048527 TaxID=3365568 RepID=UPI00370FDFAF